MIKFLLRIFIENDIKERQAVENELRKAKKNPKTVLERSAYVRQSQIILMCIQLTVSYVLVVSWQQIYPIIVFCVNFNMNNLTRPVQSRSWQEKRAICPFNSGVCLVLTAVFARVANSLTVFFAKMLSRTQLARWEIRNEQKKCWILILTPQSV